MSSARSAHNVDDKCQVTSHKSLSTQGTTHTLHAVRTKLNQQPRVPESGDGVCQRCSIFQAKKNQRLNSSFESIFYSSAVCAVCRVRSCVSTVVCVLIPFGFRACKEHEAALRFRAALARPPGAKLSIGTDIGQLPNYN